MLEKVSPKGSDIFISDPHFDAPDFLREDVFGKIPLDLFNEFLDWLIENVPRPIRLHILGDWCNCVPYLAEALKARAALLIRLEEEIDKVIITAGNHDLRLQGCGLLNYQIDLEEFLLWQAVRILAKHGDDLDFAWRNKGNLNRWFGENIIKVGMAGEKKWPHFQETTLGSLKLMSRLFIPRGVGLSDALYVNDAKKHAKLHTISLYITGHTHRALHAVSKIYGRELEMVNLSSWMPPSEKHPDGWHQKGELFPCFYWLQERSLFVVQGSGIRIWHRMQPMFGRERCNQW